MIRKATPADMPQILAIYAQARAYMAANGNPDQWGKEQYPAPALLADDLQKEQLYVCEDEDGLDGVFVFYIGTEAEYESPAGGAWQTTQAPYGVLHRIAVSGMGKGIGSACVRWCLAQCKNMRGDTHVLNTSMQRLFEKNSFTRCTELELSCGHRIGYEKSSSGCQPEDSCI